MAPLCGPCRSGQRGTASITHAQLRTIRRGGAYVNVHTASNTAGEIRAGHGQEGRGTTVADPADRRRTAPYRADPSRERPPEDAGRVRGDRLCDRGREAAAFRDLARRSRSGSGLALNTGLGREALVAAAGRAALLAERGGEHVGLALLPEPEGPPLGPDRVVPQAVERHDDGLWTGALARLRARLDRGRPCSSLVEPEELRRRHRGRPLPRLVDASPGTRRSRRRRRRRRRRRPAARPRRARRRGRRPRSPRARRRGRPRRRTGEGARRLCTSSAARRSPRSPRCRRPSGDRAGLPSRRRRRRGCPRRARPGG